MLGTWWCFRQNVPWFDSLQLLMLRRGSESCGKPIMIHWETTTASSFGFPTTDWQQKTWRYNPEMMAWRGHHPRPPTKRMIISWQWFKETWHSHDIAIATNRYFMIFHVWNHLSQTIYGERLCFSQLKHGFTRLQRFSRHWYCSKHWVSVPLPWLFLALPFSIGKSKKNYGN